jgi:hypothetical protein
MSYMSTAYLLPIIWPTRDSFSSTDSLQKTGTTTDQEKINTAIDTLAQSVVKREPFSRSEEKANLKTLYTIVKEVASQACIKESSDDFVNYVIAVQQAVGFRCLDLTTSEDQMPVVAGRVVHMYLTFTGKMIKDVVAEYARQPLSAITVTNFTRKAFHLDRLCTVIKNHFPKYCTPFIEAKMRGAILDNHGVAGIKKAAEAQLDPPLILELKQLCGPDGFNGTVNAAYHKKDESEAANKKHAELSNRVNEIAHFNRNGEIIGGKVFDTADPKTIQAVKFYYELANDSLFPSSRAVRTTALHNIAMLHDLATDHF